MEFWSSLGHIEPDTRHMTSIQYITSLSTKRLAQVLFQIFSFSNTLGFASGVCSLISEKPDSAYFTGQIPWVGASGGSCLPL